MVEPETGGDPQGRTQYTRSSLRSLAERLGRGCATTVGRLLKPLGYSLKTNVKRLIGNPHPQRDQQYRFIQRLKGQFQRHGQPVISVDAKKSELIGAFKNAGSRYCRHADIVNTYDFPSDALCRATPYGVYDAQAHEALVNVGTSATTAAFAVTSIRHWWEQLGRARYPHAEHLLIEADAGGCNGYRPRLWKCELQRLANETGLSVTVCHYPSGASKWNPIEHRLFSQISRNWAGHPLRSLDTMLALIRGTTTTTRLQIKAILDTTVYAKGIKISLQDMAALNMRRRRLCPNLNYTIRPNKSGNS
ncbi:ISAzo13 family transposase [Thiorhodococcus drewsii]|uniref:ISAzo13 family transposase n=1 Tax=Thiorhodococcus drewsii TaxID=210408 RepID=UPI001FE1B7F0|nr:ISAzo13 family transposase [Thiorhodococcus drewsii]